MTSRGQCPRGGGGACECLHPPPLQEILYPRLDRDPPKSFTLFRPLPTRQVSNRNEFFRPQILFYNQTNLPKERKYR